LAAASKNEKKIAIAIPNLQDADRAVDVTVDLKMEDVAFVGEWFIIPAQDLKRFKKALKTNCIRFTKVEEVRHITELDPETQVKVRQDALQPMSIKDLVEALKA
jgi:hypothetical protein